MTTQPGLNSPEAHLLARSLFGLLAIATFISLIGGILLLLAPIGAGARLPLLGAYGLAFILMIAACAWLLRIPLEKLPLFTARVVRWTPRGIGAGIATLGIALLNVIAQAVITAVAPSIAAVLWALAAWSLVLVVVLAIGNSAPLKAWWLRSQSRWAALGMGVTALLLLVLLAVISRVVMENSGWLGALRGGNDPRQLIWYGDEINPERSRAYWVELGQLSANWLPYTYSRIEPHAGPLFTVDAAGLRGTVNVTEPSAAVPSVYFFGGSTMWGEGSRDAYTIPSQTAQFLYQAGSPAHITNYGQVAYVTEQDLILFQRQLVLGRIPDVAVFYGGFNDLAAVYMSNYRTGLPHNEVNRIRDLRAGAVLRADRPLLTYPDASLDELDFSLVGVSSATPEDVVTHYLGNLRLIRSIAEAYGIQVLFVWQPAPQFKPALTDQEQYFMDENRRNWPDFDALYRDVDQILRERAAAEGLEDLLFLSDLFADESGYIFYDRIHIIEDGNTQVARAITAALIPLLSAADR